MLAPKRYTAPSPDRPFASLPNPVVCSRVALAAAAFVLAACARAPSDPPPTLALKDCRLPGIDSAALCGTQEVWENRDAKQGRRITLHVAVLPAKRRAKDPDPIVVLAGGPGQGAISLADQVLPLFARLNDTRDLVFVDQRGTGSSNALDCEERDGGSIQSVFEDALPATLVRECLRTLDADPRQYVTTVAMHDLDDVLGALGYAKVNLWGGSYGTRAALEFMRRHPQRVRSTILDGVAPPGMKLPLSFVGDGDAALESLLADCAAQPLCAKSYPSLRQDISALRSRLARNPARAYIQDPVTGEREAVRVTENVLLSGLFRPLYSPELSSLLPLGIVAAADGDFNPLLAQNLEFAGDVADNLSIGMHLSVICSEDVPRISAEDLASIANSFFGRSLVDDFLGACRLWPHGEVPKDYYDPVRSDAPVLILSGGIDPATPPRHGALVAASLPNARHFIAPHLAHGVSMHGCAPRLIERFVRDGSAKDIDATCLTRIPRPSFVLPLGTSP